MAGLINADRDEVSTVTAEGYLKVSTIGRHWIFLLCLWFVLLFRVSCQGLNFAVFSREKIWNELALVADVFFYVNIGK